jgi:hypothetical protein
VELRLMFQGALSHPEIQTLVDSGATLNLMSQHFIKQLLHTLFHRDREVYVWCLAFISPL